MRTEVEKRPGSLDVYYWLRLLKNSASEGFCVSAITNSGRFCFCRRRWPQRCCTLRRFALVFGGWLGVHQSGGGLAMVAASRLRFWAMAVSRNSSRAPASPRRRNRISARLALASPNSRSIRQRSLASDVYDFEKMVEVFEGRGKRPFSNS